MYWSSGAFKTTYNMEYFPCQDFFYKYYPYPTVWKKFIQKNLFGKYIPYCTLCRVIAITYTELLIN